jgi:hypothetical protein
MTLINISVFDWQNLGSGNMQVGPAVRLAALYDPGRKARTGASVKALIA